MELIDRNILREEGPYYCWHIASASTARYHAMAIFPRILSLAEALVDRYYYLSITFLVQGR
jgi:hypothetical protein